MKSFITTIFLAALPLSFASGALMTAPAMDSLGWGADGVFISPHVVPATNVVPRSVVSSISRRDSSVTDPLPVRHGMSGVSNEYSFAIKPCSSTDVSCGEHIALNVSTGCPGCSTSKAAAPVDPPPTGVPEPAAWALAGVGLAGLSLVRRRSRG